MGTTWANPHGKHNLNTHMGQIWEQSGQTHVGYIWKCPYGYHMGTTWENPCGKQTAIKKLLEHCNFWYILLMC